MNRRLVLHFFVFLNIFASVVVSAQEENESPWLVTPTLSSDPKLGNTIGAMGGYLVKFDEDSPTSMFGAMASFSDTNSDIYGLFARTYFSGDSHRLMAGVMNGNIENDYEDFLGSGVRMLTTDDLNIGFIRYLKRGRNNWFFGAQLISMNYDITGRDERTQIILKLAGIEGFSSNGVGVVIERDTRDTNNSPQSGSFLNLSNTAFREGLGGDVSFDRYSAKYSKFMGHGGDNVLAAIVKGSWSKDAPVSGYSSVDLRGYTRGEYLSPHSVTMEVEERYAFGEKWGATAFAGAACLYGDGASCNKEENWYPAMGAGITYMIKKQERMIVRAEIAVGKSDNNGFYVQFGNAF